MMTDPVQLFGVPLALDIGTALGLLVGGGLVTTVVSKWRQRSHEERLRNEQDSRLAIERYRTHREALEIHESVASLEIFEALERTSDPAAKNFLIAAYHRAQSRYLAFNDSKSDGLSSDLESLVTGALDRIAAEYPVDLGKAQLKVAEKRKRRSNDRSKYFVGDTGSLSKHHTLHVIARRFCERNGITTKEDFIGKFGDIVRTEIGAEVEGATFRGPSLLHDPSLASESHKKRHGARERQTMQDLGAIRLDDVDHLLGWEMGYDKVVADIGRRVHRPLIDHFAELKGYQDIRLDESSV